MASITVNLAPTITSGTATVYPRSNWPATVAPSGSPAGSSTTTGSVGTDGNVTFSGLTEGQQYVAYQSTPDRYIGFMVDGSEGSSADAVYVRTVSTDPLLVDRVAATPTAMGANAAAPAGAVKLWGYTIRETAGSPAVVRIRDGVVGGTVLATISLLANESPPTALWSKPILVTHANGPYIQVVSGTIEGTVFTS